jgi:predicted nuclease of predicted toxin-antitoxin system
MKLLLDENLPKRLKHDFPGHEVYTVRDKGWNGKKNGELLALMTGEKFDSLITFDKNLEYQQNFLKFSLPVLVLDATDNSYETLCKLIPEIKLMLSSPLNPGPHQVSERK